MATRWWMMGALIGAVLGTVDVRAATVRTANFVVEAPTQELAQEFAQLAEQYRKQKAIDWLGQEIPRWSSPCPLKVTVTMGGAKGATSFDFPNGQVYQSMFIEGPLDRLRNSVLPHEITHTVLAHHFRRPVPRWADEGGSVYSEDEIERTRHDRMCRDILNAGRGMPLRRLFNLKEYPSDVMVLYAQGYAVSKYLIEMSDRQTFLNFVGHGMQAGWDDAARTYYRYKGGIDEMEQVWLDHLRNKGRNTAVARGSNPAPAAPATGGDNKLVVRQNVLPAQPSFDPLPVSRGQAPTTSFDQTFGERSKIAPPPPARLGEPVPLSQTATPSAAPATTMANSRGANSPPPVVLFPPEPLPLR